MRPPEEGARDGPVGAAGTSREWAAVIRAQLRDTRPLHDADSWRVPGLTLSASQRLRRHFPPRPVPAAVLVPLVERSPLTVLLTQRATQLRNHAGQISFPGGRIEPSDAGPEAAALREAREEIGLDRAYVSVAGFLPDHIVLTGFRVTPVVGFVRPGFELLLDAREVADTFEVPLDYVFDPRNHRLQRRRAGSSGEELEFRDIAYGSHNIWGATAGMLMTLYRLCVAEEA